MSTPIRINPGIPPLLWSNIKEAFDNINQNFTSVYATIEGDGGTPVDFNNLLTNVSPQTTDTFNIGSTSKRWQDLYLSGTINVGSATITAVGSVIDLPAGSTVGGDLLIDEDYFKTIAVTGQDSVVADEGTDTVTLNSGNGISITTDASTDTINFSNTGIISASAGSGISVSGTNPLQITNTGIISASAGSGISVSGTNPLQITNTGVTRLEAGNGMIVDANTGIITITNGSPASTLRCFEYINLGSGGVVRADNNFDTLNITGDEHILINKTGSAASNYIEFTFNNRVDIIGSVFGEDSSVLVDATSGIVVGPVSTSSLRTSESKIALGSSAGNSNQGNFTVAIGYQSGETDQSLTATAIGYRAGRTTQGVSATAVGGGAGQTSQGAQTVAVGGSAGNDSQGLGAVAVGALAGGSAQGEYAIALGYRAGSTSQPANSIVINATGTTLNGSAAGFFVDPIRSTANGTPLMYDSSTKEIFYSSVLTFTGSTIDTGDSSGITVAVQTTFNTDVIVENELYIKSSRVLSISEIKDLVAASSDFADFKARIAAL